MTTFNPPILQESRSIVRDRSGVESPLCVLKWRQKQLIVLRSQQPSSHLPALTNERRLIDCLSHSPIRLVRADASLGESGLRFWANACERAHKMLYLRLPAASQLPQRRIRFFWGCKRLIDLGLALLLVMILSPVMLTIAALVKVSTPGPVLFRQWRVGQRGKLFRVLKFRTMTVNAEDDHHQVMAGQAQTNLHKRDDDPRITPLGRWLRKYSLDELPQLLNVLRGEMSLVGPRPWALYDAVRIRPDLLERLNALPGITGAWQIQARSHLLDIDTVSDLDLDYLRNWSLAADFKILLRTVPKVLSGFGAY